MPGLTMKRAGDVRHVQGMVLADWTMSGLDGKERGKGTNVFVFSPTGRIEWVTGFWGLFASVVAVWAAELGSLIEVVNRFGSFFYGSVLGVFILAIGIPRANGHGAFIGLAAGMTAVAWAAAYTNVAFLWHNVIGAVTVVVVGIVVSLALRVE